jgi:spermidine/putrescine transport system substrate-binding protein
MKKFISAAVALLISALACFGGARLLQKPPTPGSHTLVIYNWGDYVAPSLIKKFERETGYRVSYQTFDSNEAMLTKIRQGGTHFDIAVPSDYTIAKMRKEHLLNRLDHRQLHNMHYVGKEFLNKSFDPHNNYSVPYFWGTLGIVYNDRLVKKSQVAHWNDLWSPRLRDSVMLVDSARDVMGFALISQGQSLNTTNHVQLRVAAAKLNELQPNVKAIVADEIKMYMEQGDAKVAVTWSGEAQQMIAVNHNLHYLVPSEGSNLWFDNLVIPKGARNKKAAYAFINFMLRPENAAANATYVGYSTPVTGAQRLLKKQGRFDPKFYPGPAQMAKLQVFKNLSQAQVQEYNDLFLNFKMNTR